MEKSMNLEQEDNRNKSANLYFILCGFIVVTLVSIGIFLFLMNRMANKSKDATMNIANFYIERMNVEVTSHFKTTIDIKLSQVESIIRTMPPEGELQGEELKDAMIASGIARKFRFLGLMDEKGNMEVLFGDDLVVSDLDAFVGSLQDGSKDVAWSVPQEQQKGVVLLGVPCNYEMNGIGGG